jgi:RNA:NAD 2'-phosphotransferase (TPT1/KptA family)
MDAQGWVSLPTLLKELRKGVTEEQVRRVVDSNDKVRLHRVLQQQWSMLCSFLLAC